MLKNSQTAGEKNRCLRAVCYLLLLGANSSRFFGSAAAPSMSVYVCVLMFFSLCNFGNVFINHTQREPVTPCRTTCQCGRYISRQLLQIIYLLSRLDISCTCHKYLCKTNISRAIYTHLIAAYKDLRAEVVFRNVFHCLFAWKITERYCELIK